MILAGVNTVSTMSGGRISGALIDQFADAVVTGTGTSGDTAISRFVLINADTDQPVAGFDPLVNGAVINLRSLPTRNLNVAAITQPAAVGSVQFTLNGSVFRTESAAPYALAGDSAGNYYPWNPAPGTYSLTAVPFSGANASGSPGTQLNVSFTVVDQASGDSTPPAVTMTAPAPNATVQGAVAVSANATDDTGVAGVQFLLDGAPLGAEVASGPYAVTWDTTGSSGSHTLSARARDAAGNVSTADPITVTVGSSAPPPAAAVTSVALINADTDQPVAGFDPIAEGAVIQHSALPTSNLNIVARTSGGGIASVTFVLNGSTVRVENAAPYAIGGDSGGDYWPWTLPSGAFTLTVTPYSGTNATGTPGQPLTLKFTVQ